MFQVPPHPPDRRKYNGDANNKIKTMKQSLKRRISVPLLAKFLAHVGQAKTPWQRSQKRVDHKLFQVHARDAGWKSDEGANDGQQTAREDNELAESIEPTVG